MYGRATLPSTVEKENCTQKTTKRAQDWSKLNMYVWKYKSCLTFSFSVYVMLISQLDMNTLHLWLQIYSLSCSQVGWICMRCGDGAAHSRSAASPWRPTGAWCGCDLISLCWIRGEHRLLSGLSVRVRDYKWNCVCSIMWCESMVSF